jgi:hypothetical protein
MVLNYVDDSTNDIMYVCSCRKCGNEASHKVITTTFVNCPLREVEIIYTFKKERNYSFKK